MTARRCGIAHGEQSTHGCAGLSFDSRRLTSAKAVMGLAMRQRFEWLFSRRRQVEQLSASKCPRLCRDDVGQQLRLIGSETAGCDGRQDGAVRLDAIMLVADLGKIEGDGAGSRHRPKPG